MSGDRSTRRGRGGGRGGGRAAAIRGPHSALTDFLAVSLICLSVAEVGVNCFRRKVYGHTCARDHERPGVASTNFLIYYILGAFC
jgi:hypothetical protein